MIETLSKNIINFNLERLDKWRGKFSFPLSRNEAIEILLDERKFDTEINAKDLWKCYDFDSFLNLYNHGDLK